MFRSVVTSFGVSLVLALGACSAEVADSETDSVEQEIVRASSNGGKDQVVLLYATVVNGSTGAVSTRSCSGTYFAERVLVTAAHCIDTDPARSESIAQLLVYHGEDFAKDIAELVPSGIGYQVPVRGQRSVWAEADSFEAHPKWDRQQLYPDLGVVYLDRKLPFEPLPLARFALDRTWENRKATITGWGADHVTSPTTGAGGRVQRTGETRLIGSPTAADYHAEDPNPGMLVPAARKNVIKIDGRAPNANACFGDSGGPLLVSVDGKKALAGVEYFGGLSCEEYSLFTRVEPFLPFLDKAAKRGGTLPLTPKLDCVAPNADGSFTAFFGYQNENGVGLDLARGSKNSLSLDTANYRPTHFEPGEHHFVFGADFAASQTLVYSLTPASGAATTLRVDKRSKRCGAEVTTPALCGQACRAQLRSGCSELPGYEQCIQACAGFYDIFRDGAPDCMPLMDDWNRCLANTASGPSHWMCIPESGPGAGDGIADAAECAPFIERFFACTG